MFVEQANEDIAAGLLSADAPERAIYGDDTKGDHVSAYADGEAQKHLVNNFIFQMDANRKTTSLVSDE